MKIDCARMKAEKLVLSQQSQQRIKPHLLIRDLRSNAEDFMDERDLSCHIISIDILDLSFADHRHRFIAFERASSRVEGTES